VISGNKEKNHSNGQNIHHTGFLGGSSTVFVEITLFDNGGSGLLVVVVVGVGVVVVVGVGAVLVGGFFSIFDLLQDYYFE